MLLLLELSFENHWFRAWFPVSSDSSIRSDAAKKYLDDWANRLSALSSFVCKMGLKIRSHRVALVVQ